MKGNKTHKLNDAQKGIVLRLLAQELTYPQVAEEIQNQFGIKLWPQALSYYKLNHTEEINRLRVEYYRDIAFTFPISHKGYRLKELMKLYRETDITNEKVSILRAVKAEIGEDIDKIADAISKSGGDNVVNIGITSIDAGELKRLAEEAGSLLGVVQRVDGTPVA